MSSAPFWKRINRLRANKRRKRLAFLKIGVNTLTDSSDIAEVFANDLEKKFSLDSNDHFNTEHRVNIDSYIREGGYEAAFTLNQKVVPTFKMKELEKCLCEMNHKTSLDPLGLSNKIIKQTRSSHAIKTHTLNFFNKCLISNEIPKSWKHSQISMLLKSGQNTSSPGSYRPISSTACLARLFERMVLTRLQDHLDKNNLIITNQSGFRKARQTKDNLLYLTQSVQQSFNENKKNLAIFFDIAGAFDKVSTMA